MSGLLSKPFTRALDDFSDGASLIDYTMPWSLSRYVPQTPLSDRLGAVVPTHYAGYPTVTLDSAVSWAHDAAVSGSTNEGSAALLLLMCVYFLTKLEDKNLSEAYLSLEDAFTMQQETRTINNEIEDKQRFIPASHVTRLPVQSFTR